jgi:predicted ATP-grasp superfamily ATP-dependent carboligase
MFVYLEGSQVVFATAKLIKAYIDGTTLRVILENNQGFDLLCENEQDAIDTLKYIVDRLDINEPMENGYDW